VSNNVGRSQEQYLHPPCTQNPECTTQWESRTATGSAEWFDVFCRNCTFVVEYQIREGCPNCEISIDKITYQHCLCSTPSLIHRIIEAAIFIAITDPAREEKCKPAQGAPNWPMSCIENVSVGISSCWKIGQPSGFSDFNVGYSCASAETCCFAKYKVCHIISQSPTIEMIEKAEAVCTANPNDPNAPWMLGCVYSPCPDFPHNQPRQ
jgi:hypothetical protein